MTLGPRHFGTQADMALDSVRVPRPSASSLTSLRRAPRRPEYLLGTADAWVIESIGQDFPNDCPRHVTQASAVYREPRSEIESLQVALVKFLANTSKSATP